MANVLRPLIKNWIAWGERKLNVSRPRLSESEWKEYRRKSIKERYPVCCSYWQGMYIQKDARKLLKRITKRNDAYSDPLFYCPECGKKI